MIQRIQTLWLTLAGLAALLTLKFAFYFGNKLDPKQGKIATDFTGVNNFILLILIVAVAVTCIIAIFLFKDRKLQLRLAMAALLISIINLVIYYNEIKKFDEGSLALTSVFSFIIPILIIMAIRGIYKDQKLIKSADRLR
ncbi:MAG: DUF4293 family protein [Chitinophagaceae bacterium]|nr:DUF4293 family protein [Chitinophagaceae bacterium]